MACVLSTWFRDYVYIPLGGSRVSKLKSIRNIFIIFLVSGFWHGANWTFIVWGCLHAILFIPLFVLKVNRKHIDQLKVNKYFLISLKDFFWYFNNVYFSFNFLGIFQSRFNLYCF